MDIYLFQLINGLAGHSAWLDEFMVAVAKYAPVFLAGLLLLLWISYRQPYQRAAFLAGLAALLALGVGQVIGWIVARPRPYALAAHILIARTADTSFPSDHATLAFAIAALFWVYQRRLSLALFALAVVLSFARVYVGAHYPSDTLAGALLGITFGLGVGKLSLQNPFKQWISSLFSLLARWRLAAKGPESTQSI